MLFFADSCYFIALECTSDTYHKKAISLRAALKKTRLVRGYDELVTTDIVIMEVAEKICKRAGCSEAIRVFNRLSNEVGEIIKTSGKQHFGLEYLRLYGAPRTYGRRLDFLDCINLAMMRRRGIARFISSDSGFDKVAALTRIWEPADVKSLVL